MTDNTQKTNLDFSTDSIIGAWNDKAKEGMKRVPQITIIREVFRHQPEIKEFVIATYNSYEGPDPRNQRRVHAGIKIRESETADGRLKGVSALGLMATVDREVRGRLGYIVNRGEIVGKQLGHDKSEGSGE